MKSLIINIVVILIFTAIPCSWIWYNQGLKDGKEAKKAELVSLSLDVQELKQRTETLAKLYTVHDYQIDVLATK